MEVKKKKAMICQPMNGLSDEEIEKTKLEAAKELSKEGYEVVNTFFKGSEECEWADNQKNIPVAYLSMSIAKMSEVDAVYFCKGWSQARGCKVERQVAENYGYKILGFEK